MSKNIDFYSAVQELKDERKRRNLKLDVEIDKLKSQGFDQTVTTLVQALGDPSITNNVISTHLKTIEVIVSESAIRRWRIDNGILRG